MASKPRALIDNQATSSAAHLHHLHHLHPNGRPSTPKQWERIENACLALILMVWLGCFLLAGAE